MFLAQAGQGAGGGGGNPLLLIVWLVLIVGVFYFLVMRPQKKRDNERKAMLAKLQKGDRVLTIGGIFGEVVVVKEEYVLLQVDKERGVVLKMSRTAINNVVTPESAEQEEK